MSWFVYIVEDCRGRLYTGITTDVDRRVKEHNTNQKKAAKALWPFRPVKLRWSRNCKIRSNAMWHERELKKMSHRHKELVIATAGEGTVHAWRHEGKYRSLVHVPPAKDGGRREVRVHPQRGTRLRSGDPHALPAECGPDGGDQEGSGSGTQRQCGDCLSGQVVPSFEDIKKVIKATPITRDCTEEIAERHRNMAALEVRKVLLRYGKKTGWEMVKKIFSQPLHAMTFLDRDLTNEEMSILRGALGVDVDRRGWVLPGKDSLNEGLSGRQGRVSRSGEGQALPSSGSNTNTGTG